MFAKQPTNATTTPQKIYVIGSYFGDTSSEIQRNINLAQQAGIELMKKGHIPLVPQSMYAWWEHELSKDIILQTCFKLIEDADAVFILNLGLEGSGTAKAIDMAQQMNKPMYTELSDVPQVR